MSLKYFEGVDSIELLESEYRRLAKELHPDMGGSNKDFQDMNEEYKRVKIALELIPSLRPSVETKPDKPKRKSKVKFSEKRQTAIVESFGEIGRNLAEEGMEIIFSKIFGAK